MFDTRSTVLLEIFSSFPGLTCDDETTKLHRKRQAVSLALTGEHTLCLVVNGGCRENILRSVLLPPKSPMALVFSPQSLYFVLNTIPMGCLHWSAPDPKSIED